MTVDLDSLVTADWFLALRQHVEQHGVTKTAITLGFNNHTGLSRLLNGKYDANPKIFELRVRERLMSRDCPVRHVRVTASDCKRLAGGSPPTWNPLALMQWKECQKCPFKTEKGV